MFYEQENEKYTCPTTGAHFKLSELCIRLERLRILRIESNAQPTFKNSIIAVPKTKSGIDSLSHMSSENLLKESGQSENFVEDTIDERDISHEIYPVPANQGAKEALQDVRKQQLAQNNKKIKNDNNATSRNLPNECSVPLKTQVQEEDKQ